MKYVRALYAAALLPVDDMKSVCSRLRFHWYQNFVIKAREGEEDTSFLDMYDFYFEPYWLKRVTPRLSEKKKINENNEHAEKGEKTVKFSIKTRPSQLAKSKRSCDEKKPIQFAKLRKSCEQKGTIKINEHGENSRATVNLSNIEKSNFVQFSNGSIYYVLKK